jgi:AAA15 family ATPase/GTPase
MSLTIDGETMRGIIEKGEEVINFEVRDQKIYEITRDGDVLNLNLLDAYDFLFMYPKSTVTYFLKLQNIKLEEDNVVKYRYTNVTAGTSLYEYVDVYIKDYKVEKMVSESAGTTTVVTYE